ncbi:MAG: hypothetical protein JSW64_13380, partial [Candidatus Zixiibacteriota bacterium]
MLKRHKNGFIDIIKESGFDIDSFKVHEEKIRGFDVFVIEFLGSPLVFELHNSYESYFDFDYRYSLLAKDFPMSEFYMNGKTGPWASIKDVYREFKYWLENVVKDYLEDQKIPDLWVQLEQQREFIPSAKMEKDDTLPYSDEEKTQLRLSINEFRLQIVNNFQPNDDKIKVIDERLNYLSEALDRLNRIDWKSVALSSIIAIS